MNVWCDVKQIFLPIFLLNIAGADVAEESLVQQAN